MASLNKALIIGNLGQDPELRYTQNRTPVVTLNIATTEVWNREGEKQESTEWHRVVVWGRQAENCAKFLRKGRSVFIEGRVQTRSWEDRNSGQKKYITEIVANNVQFLSNNARANGGDTSQYLGAAGAMDSQEGSAEEPSQQGMPSAVSGATNSSSASDSSHLDDMPF